jgi:hypothetical protein
MDYFLYPLSATEACKVPFPADLALSKRAAYMAKPPAAALDGAERVALAPAAPPTPAADSPTPRSED